MAVATPKPSAAAQMATSTSARQTATLEQLRRHGRWSAVTEKMVCTVAPSLTQMLRPNARAPMFRSCVPSSKYVCAQMTEHGRRGSRPCDAKVSIGPRLGR